MKCFERLTPAAHKLLSELARANGAPVKVKSNPLRSARALERREPPLTVVWETPEGLTLASITEQGREHLTAHEKMNVARADWTPGLHLEGEP